MKAVHIKFDESETTLEGAQERCALYLAIMDSVAEKCQVLVRCKPEVLVERDFESNGTKYRAYARFTVSNSKNVGKQLLVSPDPLTPFGLAGVST